MDGNKFIKDGHTYMSGIRWLCHWQQDFEGQERRSILVVCKIWKNLNIKGRKLQLNAYKRTKGTNMGKL